MISFQRYQQAEKQLNQGLIRLDRSRTSEVRPGRHLTKKMVTMKRFLADCGNPQQGLPAIHVTGTSGKGSVCAHIAGILTKAGYKVGLHVSPYLQAATEKIWIDGRLVSPDTFVALADWVMPVARKYLHPHTPASIHGMAQVAICLEAFSRAKVDVIVMEAGCGGRTDLTSLVETEVAVITNVGPDHLKSLGPTLDDVAGHKAGIIRPGKPVVSGVNTAQQSIIKREADRLFAPMTIVHHPHPIAHNRLLATTAARLFANGRGQTITPQIIDQGLGSVLLPGRTECIQRHGPTVFLDGAHNRDKLNVALNTALEHTSDKGKKFLLFGLLGVKDEQIPFERLAHIFDVVIVTEPDVIGKTAMPAARLSASFRQAGARSVMVAPLPETALQTALNQAGPEDMLLITGSFYLCGQLREHWFKKKQVIFARTSFPTSKLK